MPLLYCWGCWAASVPACLDLADTRRSFVHTNIHTIIHRYSNPHSLSDLYTLTHTPFSAPPFVQRLASVAQTSVCSSLRRGGHPPTYYTAPLTILSAASRCRVEVDATYHCSRQGDHLRRREVALLAAARRPSPCLPMLIAPAPCASDARRGKQAPLRCGPWTATAL